MHYGGNAFLGQYLFAYIFKLFLGFYLSVCSSRLFSFKNIDKCVFYDRLECLEKVKVAKDKYKRKDKMEVEYEEY